jgi:hypothetical protein
MPGGVRRLGERRIAGRSLFVCASVYAFHVAPVRVMGPGALPRGKKCRPVSICGGVVCECDQDEIATRHTHGDRGEGSRDLAHGRGEVLPADGAWPRDTTGWVEATWCCVRRLRWRRAARLGGLPGAPHAVWGEQDQDSRGDDGQARPEVSSTYSISRSRPVARTPVRCRGSSTVQGYRARSDHNEDHNSP